MSMTKNCSLNLEYSENPRFSYGMCGAKFNLRPLELNVVWLTYVTDKASSIFFIVIIGLRL